MVKNSVPYRVKVYGPQKEKSFVNALKKFVATEFPRLGGPKVIDLFVENIIEFIHTYFPEKRQLTKGTLSWIGVDVTDTPSLDKKIEDTRLKPVFLPLITDEDIADVIKGEPRREGVKRRIVRVLTSAYEAGVLLTYTELGLLFNCSSVYISSLVKEYEEEQRTILPCRATKHDLGGKVSHKALICQKRFLENKLTPEIAKETNHSPQAVDRYLLDYERYQFCREKAMSIKESAYSLSLSHKLASQYEAIYQNIKKNYKNRKK